MTITSLLMLSVSCGADQPTPGDGPSSIVDGSPKAVTAKLRAFHGTPVVVNYWASWCSPCRKEFPRFKEAVSAYRGRVAFLGVNVGDIARFADSFAKSYGVPFQSLAVTRDEVRKLDPKFLGLPLTQFYDEDGKLVSVHRGQIFADELGEQIEDLLS